MSEPEQDLTALYRDVSPVIYRRCLRVLRDPELAREATQEVFFKLARDWKRLLDRATALPWIYRTALHHCLNVRRDARRRAERELLLPVREEAAEVGYENRALTQELLEQFDADTQAIAVGMLVDGLQQVEVAQMLGISTKTVHRKLERFLGQARVLLARMNR